MKLVLGAEICRRSSKQHRRRHVIVDSRGMMQ
jgi:hypothetical protein